LKKIIKNGNWKQSHFRKIKYVRGGDFDKRMTVYLGNAKAQYFGERGKTGKPKAKTIRKEINFSMVIFWLSILLVGLILGYIFTINKIATLGYNIKTTERKIQELKNQNDNLQIKSSELMSINTLENKATDLGMVRPIEVDYLNVTEKLALTK